MDFVGNNWQERPPPVDVRTPYTCSTVNWPSTSWGCDAETQTLSHHELVSEALKAMITDRLRSKGLPLIACAHTRGFQLQNIINGIVESHRVTCKQPNQVQHQGNTSLHEVDDDENEVQEASRLIEELSSALSQPMQQHSGSGKATTTGIRQLRKRHMGNTESGAPLERKKAKRAPKGTVYPCAKCSTTFSMQKDLIKHYNTVHSLCRPFKCDKCELWFKTNSERTKHIKAVHLNLHKFYCSICNRGCSSQNKLIEHENIHLKDKDRPIKCKYCNKGFPSTKDLKVHVRTHEVETKVQCELCTARFVSFNHSYKCHMKLVHKAHVRYESNKCLLCDKEFGEFKQRPLLMEHMKENHSDMGFACKECGRKCDTAAKLATHEQSVHRRVPVSAYNPKKVDVGVGDVSRELLMCKLCGGMFALRTALDQHLPIHFNNEDALSKKELAEIVDMQVEASITSYQLSKIATSLIEKIDSHSHVRKSSKKKKRKRLNAPKKSPVALKVKHQQKGRDKSCQSQTPVLKNRREPDKSIVQSTTAVSSPNDNSVSDQSGKTEPGNEDNMREGVICSATLSSQSKKGEVESKQLSKKSLQPEICTTVNSNTTGRKYLSAPGHPTLIVDQSASQSAEGSNQDVESHQTEVTKPRNRNTVEDGMKRSQRIVLKSESKNDAEMMVERSTTTVGESKENQHDSSKTDGQLVNAAKVCSKPQLQIRLPPGVISGGKAPNPDQVREMIRTGKMTISMKVPVTKLTPTSSSIQQSTSKTLVLMDSTSTPGIINKTLALDEPFPVSLHVANDENASSKSDAEAASSAESDTKASSSSEYDTVAASSSTSDAKVESSSNV
ncbi:uncharacterized protein [Amphiura filiformis]|uniref:uncharacterized protein n=1 Tax=Amphiura filiformis TaxID=82378 RepID=UPI003B222533